MSLILLFIVFTIISLSGLILYIWKNIPRTPLLMMVALGAGSMLTISLTHIFPEAISEGWEWAIFGFLWGFIALYILEEIFTGHKHDHTHGDHTHEDPHEHSNHVSLVAWGGIFLHTLLDGLSIAASFHISEELWYAVLFGIMIHQIPVSLGLAGILRQSQLQIGIQYLLMILFGVSALVWWGVSHLFLDSMSHVGIWIASAFAGGSLLYIATTDLIPMIHGQSKHKYSMLLCFLVGVMLMIGSHEIGYEHHEETWVMHDMHE